MDARHDALPRPLLAPGRPVSRRSWLAAALALAGGAALPGLGGCGGPSGAADGDGVAARAAGVELVTSRRGRAAADARSRGPAAAGVQDFGAGLFRAVAAGTHDNAVLSPLSLHVVLAMTAAGARGATQAELLKVLHATGAGPLASGLNALSAHVSSLAGRFRQGDGDPVEVRLGLAGSVWAQRGAPWAPAYLDALAADYGAGVHAVDLQDPAARERARAAINEWVRQQTAGTIQELVGKGALDAASRLVLANALYLKAPWQKPFEPSRSTLTGFTRRDGTTVPVMFMHADLDTAFATGDGWRAARVPYAGRLAMTVLLPDPGRFDAVVRGLDGDVLRSALTATTPAAVDLALPRWRARSTLSLRPALEALGLRTAFTDGADLGGMTTDATPLKVAAVLHQGFVAVDEHGTEASAASAVVVSLTSAPARRETLHLDRPFLFAVHDVETATPLFIGQVTDPSAAA